MSHAARRWQLVATAVVAVLVLLAGCSGFGGSSTVSETGETPGVDSTASTDTNATTDGTTGADETDGTVQNVSDVALGADGSDDSYTVTMNTRIEDGDGAVVENRTLEVGNDGRVAGETRRRVTGGGEPTTTDSYTNNSVTYLRHTAPDVDVSSYERISAENVSARSGLASLDQQFAFAHESTGEDTHRFTVDSVDQVTGSTAVDGTVENVSVTVVVESGIVTRLDYDLRLSTADGPVEYHTTRTVSDRGATTVSPPEWLQQAENRTLPLQ